MFVPQMCINLSCLLFVVLLSLSLSYCLSSIFVIACNNVPSSVVLCCFVFIGQRLFVVTCHGVFLLVTLWSRWCGGLMVVWWSHGGVVVFPSATCPPMASGGSVGAWTP